MAWSEPDAWTGASEWDGDLIGYLHEETTKSAEQGRQIGVYGPEISVSASAPRPGPAYSASPAAPPAWTA